MSVINLVLYFLKHRLLKNTFIYAGSNFLRQGIPFFLLPILTRYLTTSDYGIIAIFQALLPMMIVLVGLNMNGAVAVNFFKMDRQELNVYIGNMNIVVLANFVLTLTIVQIFKTHLSHLTNFPADWLIIMVIVALCQSVFMLPLTLWQVEQKPAPYGVFQILGTLLDIGLSLFFVVLLGWRWEGRISGISIASIILGLLSILIICKRRYITFLPNKNHIKDALAFGIPLVPQTLGGYIMACVDRLFISSMVSVAATGIYTAGYQAGMIIGLLVYSFNQAWSPYLFEKLKENNHDTNIRIVKFTYLYDAALIVLAVALSLAAPSILNILVGREFQTAHKYVFWIALGYAAHGMYLMVVNYFFYAKKTYILAWTTSLSALANILLNYFLIRANGPIGAAQATAITFLMNFIITWAFTDRAYRMPWLEALSYKTC